jgi:hypothetical protein
MDQGLAQAVARDAGADAFITGALLKVGPTQLRLDVRVQDTQSRQIVESEKLEGESVQNIFGMVDSLTARIAGHFLPGGSIPGKAPAIEQAATSNVEAYRHYQLGLEAQNRYLSADAIRELCSGRVGLPATYCRAVLARPARRLPFCGLDLCHWVLRSCVFEVRQGIKVAHSPDSARNFSSENGFRIEPLNH